MLFTRIIELLPTAAATAAQTGELVLVDVREANGGPQQESGPRRAILLNEKENR